MRIGLGFDAHVICLVKTKRAKSVILDKSETLYPNYLNTSQSYHRYEAASRSSSLNQGIYTKVGHTEVSNVCGAERVEDCSREPVDCELFFVNSTVVRASLAISLTKGSAMSGDANSKRVK